jgi:hypothetical protein
MNSCTNFPTILFFDLAAMLGRATSARAARGVFRRFCGKVTHSCVEARLLTIYFCLRPVAQSMGEDESMLSRDLAWKKTRFLLRKTFPGL